MKNDTTPRVYDVLARAFMQEGVRTCFALLGDANMNWAARLSEQGCRMVLNDGAYGSEVHKLRSEGLPEDGSVFGYSYLAGIARGFGLQGRTFKNLDGLPKLVAEFAASGGAAVWDFHVSDKVVSPTIRRAHPQR